AGRDFSPLRRHRLMDLDVCCDGLSSPLPTGRKPNLVRNFLIQIVVACRGHADGKRPPGFSLRSAGYQELGKPTPGLCRADEQFHPGAPLPFSSSCSQRSALVLLFPPPCFPPPPSPWRCLRAAAPASSRAQRLQPPRSS